METRNRLDQTRVTTIELALTSTLAAVYIVSAFFALTPFIGGPGFITLEIVMLPIIAFLLRPVLATAAAFVGSLGSAFIQTSFFHVFGLPGLLIPLLAVALGSIAFHYEWGPIAPWAYVLAGAVYYIIFSKGGTLFWLAPYTLVMISLPAALRAKHPYRIGLLALYTAMSEQVSLNVLSISLLNLTGDFWIGVTPLMFIERTVATLGAFAVIVALKSQLGRRLELGRVLREVK
ncbi:hypothetical protein E6H19_05145 [Candidatus Bathyarchaeota archaeon]|nr:MAG: hypothetical protein E6H19_05145 [Candidatus Bathyarchaeota archaeon]